MARLKIALQLYTVRDLLTRDFPGTLRKIRGAGYTHVELAGHGPYRPAELRKVLSDAGLRACSDHCEIDRLDRDVQQAIGEAQELGVEYLVCPWVPEERRRTKADWISVAGVLNRAGQACRAQRIQLCYHNHSFEFARVDGRYALDLLFAETDPALVHSELDTYWVADGGEDPVDYVRRLAGRCSLVHLKDKAAAPFRAPDGKEYSFAAVGEGTLDFRAILSAAEAAGSVWGIVEQDVCPGNPLDSAAASLRNLRQSGCGV